MGAHSARFRPRPAGPAPDQAKTRTRTLLTGALVLLGLMALSCGGPGMPTDRDTGDAVVAAGATSGTSSHVQVTQTSVVSDLSPGREGQELSGTITNPHPWPVFVRSVSATVSRTSDPGCPPSSFTVQGSPAQVTALVAPGPHRGSWSGITIALKSTGTDQEACKDVSLQIAYRIP